MQMWRPRGSLDLIARLLHREGVAQQLCERPQSATTSEASDASRSKKSEETFSVVDLALLLAACTTFARAERKLHDWKSIARERRCGGIFARRERRVLCRPSQVVSNSFEPRRLDSHTRPKQYHAEG